MARLVKCVKLGSELEGFDKPPIPGELGKKIYDSVSLAAWKLFLEHFKMIMNEYRLNLMDPKTDEIFSEQVNQFFFSQPE